MHQQDIHAQTQARPSSTKCAPNSSCKRPFWLQPTQCSGILTYKRHLHVFPSLLLSPPIPRTHIQHSLHPSHVFHQQRPRTLIPKMHARSILAFLALAVTAMSAAIPAAAPALGAGTYHPLVSVLDPWANVCRRDCAEGREVGGRRGCHADWRWILDSHPGAEG